MYEENDYFLGQMFCNGIQCYIFFYSEFLNVSHLHWAIIQKRKHEWGHNPGHSPFVTHHRVLADFVKLCIKINSRAVGL